MALNRRNVKKLAVQWEKNQLSSKTGLEYVPFLGIRDVPSDGQRLREYSWTVGRVHHMMSKLEAKFFYLIDSNPLVLDIREQYPLLPIQEVEQIADSLEVKYTLNKVDHVYTTDFLLALESGPVAIHVKPSEKLKTKRTLEKLAVERYYWDRRGVPFYVVTEQDISEEIVKSIKQYHKYRDPQSLSLPNSRIEIIGIRVGHLLQQEDGHPAHIICTHVDKELELDCGTTLSVVKHFIASGRWFLKEGTLFDPDQPLQIEDSGHE